MGILNKNIDIALERLDTTLENKKLLESILYKEHCNRETNWDSTAPRLIQDILRENLKTESNDDID